MNLVLNANGSKTPDCVSDKASADLNCDEKINFMDLMLMNQLLVDGEYTSVLDTNANGRHDACDAVMAQTVVTGDITGNGIVDDGDISCIKDVALASLAGNSTAPSCSENGYTGADVNCTAGVNIVDILLTSMLVNGETLDISLDSNTNGVVDACE